VLIQRMASNNGWSAARIRGELSMLGTSPVAVVARDRHLAASVLPTTSGEGQASLPLDDSQGSAVAFLLGMAQ
jgi:hypothetical protein